MPEAQKGQQLSGCFIQEVSHQAAAEPSMTCLGLCSTLRGLGVQHERHAVSADGYLMADVLVPEHRIALLVEGMACYVRNTGKRRGEHAWICLRA